ncbi:MAG: multicopper oxidase domain-containing protein [Terricaulis sp.]
MDNHGRIARFASSWRVITCLQTIAFIAAAGLLVAQVPAVAKNGNDTTTTTTTTTSGSSGSSGSSGGSTSSFNIPTDGQSSPLFGAQPFTQKLGLFEEFGTQPMPASYTRSATYQNLPGSPDCGGAPNTTALDNFLKQPLYPVPTADSYAALPNAWAAHIGTCVHPLATSYAEGRPSGQFFSHQRMAEFPAVEYFQTAQAGARVNGGIRDSLQRHHYMIGEFGPGGLYYSGGTTRGVLPQLHPNFPVQSPTSLWTFDGTFPPKLLMARYGNPILFRHYNALPIDPSANGGFGTHTISTHEHNGHNPAESDGYTAAFFFPGQYYDYHWPMILAGHDSINTDASDPRAGYPDGHGGITRVAGDYRETMSTHWFHDHMLDYTAQNVYKGNAAMMNYYSAIDRGREGYQCNYSNASYPNLCFPSGTGLDWGNRDYDVNLVIADKAWDRNGQLWFNIFNTDGFLGDRVTVNWQWMPYMEVRSRRYRFRILNGSVSRYYKLAVVTDTGQRLPFYMIANDGNIMEHSVAFPNSESQDMPTQGIAERFDIVIDFSQVGAGRRVYLVNTLEHTDPRGPHAAVDLASILNGSYRGDPGVGKILEWRVVSYSGVDRSMNPADYVEGKKTMLDRPVAPTAAQIAGLRHRTFEFGRSGGTDDAPWTIKTDGGQGFNMDPHRVSAAPTQGEWEVWHLKTSGGWAHPVHIHFEEGRILDRDGAPPPIWERGARKDVYRIGEGPNSSQELDLLIRFREFVGTYMEHCHNTQHEDHSMLLRWDLRRPGDTIAIPTPINTWEGTFYEPSQMLPTATTGTVASNSGSGSSGR